MPLLIEADAEPIPGYRLIERLGGGGFGEVWKCEAPGKIQKAIKFVYGDLEDVGAVDDSIKAEQELRSIERIKNIRHPYILSIERYEIIEGRLIIVTELADCNLYDRFRVYRSKGLMGIPREELLGYMEEIAEALDIMTTEHDLLHLDIKPQNLFLMYNHIKIGDFGLVKDLEGVNAKVTGGVTPVYAAPETFEGYVSRCSDQYSLAIVFQELLTGIRPFSGTNAKQLMMQHIQAVPNVEPLPPADRHIISKALSKKPGDRWENCMTMVHMLRHSLLKPTVEAPTEIPEIPLAPKSPIPVSPMRGKSQPPDATIAGTSLRVDDYFELGPVTHHVGSRMASGLITQVRKPSPQRAVVAPIQDSSTGVLRPSILIGLGQFGRATLQWLKQSLQLQYGPSGLPIIRSIAVDTDPAPPGDHLARIDTHEDLVLTRLNRPARYIRSRDSLPPVEEWLNTNILYRMPRTQMTSGIRALGRLALIEHYRSFSARFERDLKTIMDPVVQAETEKNTKESFLSTTPRIYIVGHLGGGTASGMMIDCAYIIKHLMRKMDIAEPEIVGICYVPDDACMEAADLPEANAVAALYELYHYQQAGMPFRAIYESKSEWVEDSTPPFTQVQLIETPPRPAATQERKDNAPLQIQKVAEVLNRLLTTALGRVADPVRLTAGTSPYQTMGLRVLNSPRRALIRKASHLVFQRILDKWLISATPEIQNVVRHRIDGFFHYEKLSPESLFQYFELAAKRSLGYSSEDIIKTIIAPFQHGIHEKLPNSDEVKRALREIVKSLGSTGEGSSANPLDLAENNTKLHRALKDACEKVVRTGATRLVFTVYRHLDKSGLRMGATEEALRYAITKLDSWIASHEAKAKQAQSEYVQALEYLRQDLAEYDRLKAVPKKKWPSMTTPGERLLAIYRARLRAVMNEYISKVYIGFRGACSDQTRDVRFCRSRLLELQKATLDMEKLPEKPVTVNRITESVIIPYGCNDMLQAVQQFVDSITSYDLDKIDHFVSERMEKSHPRIGELCLSTIDQLKPVRDLIMQEAKRFLEQRLVLDDAAGLFLDKNPDTAAAFQKVYNEAEPMMHFLNDDHTGEAVFLMANESPQGIKLGEVATTAYPHTQLVNINRNDEVILYRTIVGIQLEQLPVLSELGLQAYQTALGIEHFTPHCRQDVDQWQSPVPVV
ncbi:MAG: protein kinase [Planctomycetia bacterium]|nr:protein kinase [Planctomycetia bacterium]